MISFQKLRTSCLYYCRIYFPLFYILISLFILFLCYFIIYNLENNNYILDEYYDSYNGLNDYKLQDMLTIRVKCPNNVNQLQKFVRHYTMCPCVYDLQIIINEKQQSYTNTEFIYEHTHSLVTFIQEDSERTNRMKTESVILLDSNIFVSCNDLEFTHNVWRSSHDSLVGYFPRLHSINTVNNIDSYNYHNWWYVFWHHRYSILLPSGLLLKKETWENFLGSSKESIELRNILKTHPECYNVAISLWSAYSSPSPPIWVDVPFTIDSITSSSESSESSSSSSISSSVQETIKEENSNNLRLEKINSNKISLSSCMDLISNILHQPELPYSFHKAAIAKNILFW